MTVFAERILLLVLTGTLMSVSADETRFSPDAGTRILRVGGDVRPPILAHRVQPRSHYSHRQVEAAKAAYGTDTVTINLVVTSNGQVRDARIKSGIGEPFDSSALDAVRQWTFQPATKNGRPVNVAIAVQVQFH